MFKTVFNKLHEHSHTGIKITYKTFARYYYIPFVEKWLSIFIHDCIECQRNKHINMKIQTAPTQPFSEHAPSFNYRISMDSNGPINPHHTTNLIYISYLTLLATLLLQYSSNQITQKLQSKPSYPIGLSNLDHPYILLLIVDQNM